MGEIRRRCTWYDEHAANSEELSYNALRLLDDYLLQFRHLRTRNLLLEIPHVLQPHQLRRVQPVVGSTM